MNKFVIIDSVNGYKVYANLISTSAGRYLSHQPHVINLIREVLLAIPLGGGRQIIEQDMGRNIGRTDIIETTEKDSIYYAQAIKSDVFSRFAKNRYSPSSTLLTIITEQDDEGDYEIKDTWIGPASPAFPGDERETDESRTYWQTHALVQDARLIQSKSITANCPY